MTLKIFSNFLHLYIQHPPSTPRVVEIATSQLRLISVLAIWLAHSSVNPFLLAGGSRLPSFRPLSLLYRPPFLASSVQASEPGRGFCQHGLFSRLVSSYSVRQPYCDNHWRCAQLLLRAPSQARPLQPRHNRDSLQGGPARCLPQQLHVHWRPCRPYQDFQHDSALPGFASVCYGRTHQPLHICDHVRDEQSM